MKPLLVVQWPFPWEQREGVGDLPVTLLTGVEANAER